PERPALYFTVLGEPPLKMLRYQQQFAFFDPSKVGNSVRFHDLSQVLITQDLGAVLARIIQLVEEHSPGLVIVDSFQSVVRAASAGTAGELGLQEFVQRLAVHLTSWQATTFLIGDYVGDLLRNNPVFTVADGVLALTQSVDRNSVVRKLQIVKSRGHASMPGLHTFRISQPGIEVFPRMSIATRESQRLLPPGRIATGVAGLDELLGGGIPTGDAVLVSGPSGTGKSVLTTQFIAAGASQGEPGVIAVFEEHPKEYVRRAATLGIDLDGLVQQGQVAVIYVRPLDLSPDESLQEIQAAVARIGAKRVAIDSLSGFELALAPTFREDFRESLYRLVGALTGTGVTVLMTMEIVQDYGELRFSPYVVSFLADDILLLRYVEIEGELQKTLAVVKMRNSDHHLGLMRYAITARGMVMRGSLRDYRGVGSGAAELREGRQPPPYPGLTDREVIVLQAVLELGEAAVAAVAQRVGLGVPAVSAALNRLIGLDFALGHEVAAERRYRPVARSSAQALISDRPLEQE
ncbi:MAG TPA: ATPase domain-containing protein, partial [Chloroflexota bacterium]